MSPENLGAEATPQGASTDAGSVSLEQLLESSDFVPSDEQLGLGGEGDEGETTKVDVKEEVKDVKEEREEKEETKEGEEKKEAKTVPLAALHEERERRKELTKRLEESERQHATEIGTLTERINIILNSLQQQQTDRTQQTQQQKDIAELPDFIRSYAAANPYAQEKEILDAFFREEPTNYLNWQNQRILKAQEAIAERNKLQDEQERARTQFNNFMGEYRNNVNTFTAENADFPSAYNFLLNQRQQELTVMGFNAQEIGQILQNEEIGIVEQAFRNKVNPAKSIYDIAKFRGYKLEEKSEGKKEEVKEEKEEIKPTLEAEKKAEAAAKNLGGLPGTSGGKLNAEALLAMSEEEFSKATKDGEWQKIMGG